MDLFFLAGFDEHFDCTLPYQSADMSDVKKIHFIRIQWHGLFGTDRWIVEEISFPLNHFYKIMF